MALFDSVSRDLFNEVREQRDDWKARHDALMEKYQQLLQTTVDIKRQEHGLAPSDFDATANDPTRLLGPKTQLAVEEFAAGDPELRSRLIRTATLLTAVEMGEDTGKRPPPDIDDTIAKEIRNGDQ